MRPLWASWFSSAEELVIFHHLDFGNAVSLAANYSTQLAADAARSGSQDYVDILALSARQVLAATSFSGTPDDPLLFLKEISSNGNCQTIDVIFPSFPFFMYTNPRWLAYLLEPLFEHMLSGQYPNTYAMHDLGAHFPNITGHPDGQDEYMPVEECGNMLLMGLALVNSLLYEDESTSGSVWASMGSSSFVEGGDLSPFALRALESRDGVAALDDRWGGRDGSKGHRQARKFIRRTYRLWKQWTGYLVEYSLTPETQRECCYTLRKDCHQPVYRTVSTDDFAGWLANQTNLALKGILGIKAMSKLAEAIDETADVEYYTVGEQRPTAPTTRRHSKPCPHLEYLVELCAPVGRLRHLPRRHARQAILQLVRVVDDSIQSIRRLDALFPPPLGQHVRARARARARDDPQNGISDRPGRPSATAAPQRARTSPRVRTSPRRGRVRAKVDLPHAEPLVSLCDAEVRLASRQSTSVREERLAILRRRRREHRRPRRDSG